MKTYGVKPGELLRWQRLLPEQREIFAAWLAFTGCSFAEALTRIELL